MRVKIVKVATLNRHTQTTFAAGDLTAPIHTGARPARPAAPTLRARLRALWERLRGRAPVATPVRAEPDDSVTGTLVRFIRWSPEGRMDYDPFPRSADEAIDYERPLVLLLDERGTHGEERLFYTSPIYSVSVGRYGLPSRVETRSSLYELQWIETPVIPVEEVAE